MPTKNLFALAQHGQDILAYPIAITSIPCLFRSTVEVDLDAIVVPDGAFSVVHERVVAHFYA
jgi:hypothetical protein